MPTLSEIAHRDAVESVWDLLVAHERTVLVQSPPGAGKSTLVRELARRWHAHGSQTVPVITQTNEQADDLARDLATEGASVGRLHSLAHQPSPTLTGAGVLGSTDVGRLTFCDVIVATAAKWAFVDPVNQWGLGIVDEAFQMRSDLLLKVADRFGRLLLVGDPGQLKPFTSTDERIVRGIPMSPLETAAATILLTHPATPIVSLPVSWRLPPSAATVISNAFYAEPFEAGVPDGVRTLTPATTRYRTGVEEAIVSATAGGWALLELDDLLMPQVDPEAVEALTAVVERALAVGITATHERGSHQLGTQHIAVGVTHRDQRGHVRAAVDGMLERRGFPPGSVVVDTANRLQGRQFDLLVAWHPLSGRRDASSFHLESGRLCVLLSRHRHACVVVTRGGIREQLEAYPSGDPIWISERLPVVDGWEANVALLEHLDAYRVSA